MTAIDLFVFPETYTEPRVHPSRLVVLPPLRLDHPELDVDDDARFWLTTAGAIATAGIERVSLVPGLDEIVRWDDHDARWVRL